MAESALGGGPPRIGLLSRSDPHVGGQSARAETMLAPLVRAFAVSATRPRPPRGVTCPQAFERLHSATWRIAATMFT
jgi:hypothetical protein